MTIELWDMDTPYELQIDANDEGKDMVVIKPNTAVTDRDNTFDICLDANGCRKLARCLMFMAKEIRK